MAKVTLTGTPSSMEVIIINFLGHPHKVVRYQVYDAKTHTKFDAIENIGEIRYESDLYDAKYRTYERTLEFTGEYVDIQVDQTDGNVEKQIAANKLGVSIYKTYRLFVIDSYK